jgi:hypothetical protein
MSINKDASLDASQIEDFRADTDRVAGFADLPEGGGETPKPAENDGKADDDETEG